MEMIELSSTRDVLWISDLREISRPGISWRKSSPCCNLSLANLQGVLVRLPKPWKDLGGASINNTNQYWFITVAWFVGASLGTHFLQRIYATETLHLFKSPYYVEEFFVVSPDIFVVKKSYRNRCVGLWFLSRPLHKASKVTQPNTPSRWPGRP